MINQPVLFIFGKIPHVFADAISQERSPIVRQPFGVDMERHLMAASLYQLHEVFDEVEPEHAGAKRFDENHALQAMSCGGSGFLDSGIS